MRAYSLRGCQIANFVPRNLSHFLPFVSDNTTVFEDARSLGTTTTGPSYLFFYGASTRCYKPVGNVTYLLPNCSHGLIDQTYVLNTIIPGVDLNQQPLQLACFIHAFPYYICILMSKIHLKLTSLFPGSVIVILLK